MRSRTSKNNLLLLVILMIGFISLGYALLTTNINITGTGKIKDAKWDVHFANIRVTDGSVAATTAANIADKTAVDFSVTLEKPGDFYEFTIDVVNAGTIDAMVDSFSILPITLPDFVRYTAVWVNTNGIPKAKDSIPKGETYQMKIRVEMLKDITVDQLLTEEQTLSLGVQLDCVQATEEAQPIMLVLSLDDLPVNPASITNYVDGDKTAMYTITHPDDTISYRYIGDVPNNYIDFNNEVWRIIGIIDGKLKIIRNESIGSMAWDKKQNGVGSADNNRGSNVWGDSQLMHMLNPNAPLLDGYNRVNNIVTDSNGYIVYQEGKLPALVSTTSTEYPADAGDTPWKLNAEALSQVVETTYYYSLLGHGLATDPGTIMTELYYGAESSGEYEWLGKVGLVHLSDYGYTAALGVNDHCYNDVYSCEESWMAVSSVGWSIDSFSELGRIECINIDSVEEQNPTNSNAVRPVVYLNPDIKLTGTGSSTDYYKIVS